MRIRHFGFLGKATKITRLKNIRGILGQAPPKKKKGRQSTAQLMLETTGIDITLCPRCGQGRMKLIDEFSGIYDNLLLANMSRKAG